MMAIYIIATMVYLILGIGYAKTLTSLIEDYDIDTKAFAVFLWPLFLIVAAFWNFDND